MTIAHPLKDTGREPSDRGQIPLAIESLTILEFNGPNDKRVHTKHTNTHTTHEVSFLFSLHCRIEGLKKGKRMMNSLSYSMNRENQE